jgi:uncharacterized protein (TIGR03000 family)
MYHLALLIALQNGTIDTSEEEVDAARAYVTVLVPPRGKLYVNGLPSPCSEGSENHTFRTPPIEPGRPYAYALRVETSDERGLRSMCRWVYFRAGDRPTVDLRDPSHAATEPPAKMPIERREARIADVPTMPPALPDRPPPRPGLASMTDMGQMEIAYVDFRAIPYTTTTKQSVNGKAEQRTMTAYKWLPEERTRKLDMKDVRAFDMTGQPIDMSELTRLLRYRTVVALTPDGKVDPFYLQTMKEGTLILAVPDERTTPLPELELPHAIPQTKEDVPPMPPAAP